MEFTSDAVPGHTFAGRVRYVSALMDAASRWVQVNTQIPNPQELLRGGLVAKGQRVGPARRTLRLPRVALRSWDAGRGTGHVSQEGTGFCVGAPAQNGRPRLAVKMVPTPTLNETLAVALAHRRVLAELPNLRPMQEKVVPIARAGDKPRLDLAASSG